jgi:hypothetical protein
MQIEFFISFFFVEISMPHFTAGSLDAPGDARVWHEVTHITLFRRNVAHKLK